LTQATFSVKQGGIGLRSAVATSDAAYLGSRGVTHARCQALREGHSWDISPDSYLALAANRCNSIMSSAGMLHRIDLTHTLYQKNISKHINVARVLIWDQKAVPDDACNRRAYAAPLAGKILGVVPSKTLDKYLTRLEFVTDVALRLGVDVFEPGTSCPFCGDIIDARSRHALFCMCGGDATLVHNIVRDITHDYCQRGVLRPEREATGLLRGLSLTDGRRRPADVLVCSSNCLSRRTPDGARILGRKVALDFAVINAVGATHWRSTFDNPGGAELAYSVRKCNHLNTATKCLDVGLVFQPMVISAQGGMTSQMGAVLHGIAAAVATAEGTDVDAVRLDMFERISIAVVRANSRAIVRRRGRLSHKLGAASIHRFVAAASAFLEDPPGA